ncbi:hypothetical protein GIB67_035552, partial [Kingdonia uniflora]
SLPPFTTTQWQELEQQARIFKYIVSGVPIPAELLFPLKRSMDSSISSRLFPQQPMSWGCFQMGGYGRKIDPEPGRCRRTDGKKWRCSKEAYIDSKYCERHMHRGKSRSRKPVENTATTATSSITSPSTPNIPSFNNNNIAEPQHHHHPYYNNSLHHPLLYSPQSSSSRPPAFDLYPQTNNAHLVLDSAGSYTEADNKDYSRNRYMLDEKSFFSESSGTMKSPESSLDDPWRLTPLRMSSSSFAQPKERNCSTLQSQFSQLHHPPKEEEQHCFVLGTDFKSLERAVEKHEPQQQMQQPYRHFFDDLPPKNRDSWLDLDDRCSRTSLSISIPPNGNLTLI